MELLSMIMENYRRFEDKTTINFASGDKNVTIIRAENGAGKTGILMALLFGLFGTVHYEQFQIEDDKDFMVSARLLTNNKSASCTVSVNFKENGSSYTIERTVDASNINGHIQQNSSNVKTRLYKEGVRCDWDKERIDTFMNSIVGQNIRGFLFFDGVKYTDLFKQNNSTTKHELQKIIEKMLNINDLDKTIESLKVLASEASSSGSVSATTAKKLADKRNELKGIEASIKEQSEKSDSLDDAIKQLNAALNNLLENAKNLDEYRGVAEEIEVTNQEIKEEQIRLDGYLSSLVKSAPHYLLGGIYSTFGKESKATFDKLAMDKENGADIVNMILDSNKCICCDKPLTQEQRDHLELFLKELNSSDNVPFEISARSKTHLHKLKEGETSSFEGDANSAIASMKKIKSLRAKVVSLENALPNEQSYDEINRQIVEHAKNEGSLTSTIDSKRRESESVSRSLERLSVERQDAQKKIEALEEEAAVQTGKQSQYKFYDDTRKKLVSLKERYLREAQQEISKRANGFFLELLSEDDKKLFQRLELNDDYSIKVYSASNRETFGQMSAGQKLLASMAFVMGLTATASNAKPTCNFPLVMDTPFSNLDSRNRKSLIKLMPQVVKQWILTPIDTELTQNEIAFFDDGGKVGKVYYLKKDGPSTALKECQSIFELSHIGGVR